MRREGWIGLGALGLVLASVAWLLREDARDGVELRHDYVEQRFESETRGLVASSELDAESAGGRSVDHGEVQRLAILVTAHDLDGRPAPDVRFRYGLASRRDEPSVAKTDQAGEALLEIRQPRRKSRVRDVAWAELAMPGFPRLRAERTVTPVHMAGDTLTLRLVATPGRTIEGIVRDPEGEPIAGAELRIGHSPTEFNEIRTDDRGGWFVHVRPTLQELWLHARRLHVGASELCKIDVGALPEDELIELRLLGPETIEGTLVDSFGFEQRRRGIDARLAGAPVELAEHQIVSLERQGGLARSVVGLGAGGKFSIRGLQRASYELSVRGTALRPPAVPGGAWVLPVDGFYLDVFADGGRVSPEDLLQSYVDGDGHLGTFELRVASCDEFGQLGSIRVPDVEFTPDERIAVYLPGPGDYVLSATHPFGDREIVRVSLPERGRHPSVVVNLSTAGLATIRPRLPALADAPIPEGETLEQWLAFALLRVTDQSTGLEVRELVSFEEVIAVPSGSYLVEFLPFGEPAWTGRITLRPGEDRELVLEQESGAFVDVVVESLEPLLDVYLTGRLVAQPGTSSRAIELQLRPDGPELATGTTYRARIPVRPGAYRLHLAIDESETLSGNFVALAGETAEVRFSR